MEHEVDRILGGAVFLLDVFLGIVQDDGLKFHVAGFVNTMHVAERGGDGEVRADLAQLLVSVCHILGLGVEAGAVDTSVVHTILFAARDAELDFEGHLNLGHAGEILLANLNILFQRLFRKVKHVGAEERLAILGIIFLTGIQKTVNPREEFLGGMVGVNHHGNAVHFRHTVNVHGARDAALDGCLLTIIAQRLASAEHAAAVRELDHHRGVHRLGSLHHGVDRVRAHHVHRRKGELTGFRDSENFL